MLRRKLIWFLEARDGEKEEQGSWAQRWDAGYLLDVPPTCWMGDRRLGTDREPQWERWLAVPSPQP